MSEYLVDSDWAIDVLNGRSEAIEMLDVLEPSGIALSIISYGELYQGAYYGRNPEAALTDLETFLDGKEIIAPTFSIMQRFGIVRGQLPRELRRQIGPMDFLIASTALVHDLTIVTRNLRDFEHIPGLQIYEPDLAD